LVARCVAIDAGHLAKSANWRCRAQVAKTEDSNNASPSAIAEVQHLGVRFTLVSDQYWPYETSPDSGLSEAQYNPQDVPIVTGAAMLCRREEFLALGGFDEGYFYGYEDVEFCLRMGAQHGSRIVCRNDLVALHHHGYTRLTGREPSMIDHQLGNQTRLAVQLGLWSKRAFWQSLLDADNLLSNEILTIGFAVHHTDGNTQLAAAVELAERVCLVYLNVKTVFLTSDKDWNSVGELHVLVSLSPYYDLRCLKQARADLRTACYITLDSELNAWSINPSLALFDACLCVDNTLAVKAEKLMHDIARPVAVSNTAPLADLLDTNRLRVLLRVPPSPSLISAAKQLAQALKAQGSLVYTVGSDASHEQSKVVEVVISIHGSPAKHNQVLPPYERRNDVINVLWIVEDADSLRSNEVAQADQVWLAIPKLPQHLKKAAIEQRAVGLQTELMQGLAQHLQHAVEKKIERTFRTS
jgi:Predicted glycosyltransferases